eukprot:6201595-Pleurochrysis_carterae.AAC.4
MKYSQYSSPAPPRSCITRMAVGVGHVEVLEHETDLGAVEYDLVVAVERPVRKVAAMLTQVAHKVGAQRGGERLVGFNTTNLAALLCR